MGLILNRDDLVKLLQEDEGIRELIRQITLVQPEVGGTAGSAGGSEP